MHAYVFVYSPSKLKVGAHPLVRFEAGRTYSEAEDQRLISIARDAEAVVGRGIYVISSDSDDEAPDLSAAESTRTVDYDLLLVRGKDPWPELAGDFLPADPGIRARVLAAFPDLRGEHLKRFLPTLAVAAT